MEYTVAKIGTQYHIGNVSTGMTMCAKPKAKWEGTLANRNTSLIAQYVTIEGRAYACPTCEHYGKAEVGKVLANG